MGSDSNDESSVVQSKLQDAYGQLTVLLSNNRNVRSVCAKAMRCLPEVEVSDE